MSCHTITLNGRVLQTVNLIKYLDVCFNNNKGQSNLAKGDITRMSVFGTPIWGGGEIVGGQRWYHSKERWWFPMLSIVTIAPSPTIRPQFAVECHRRLNQQGWVTLWQNLGRNWLTDASQIITWSGKDIGLSYAKEIVLISSAVWAQCTNVTNVTDRRTDKQTDRPRNGNIDSNRRNRLSAM